MKTVADTLIGLLTKNSFLFLFYFKLIYIYSGNLITEKLSSIIVIQYTVQLGYCDSDVTVCLLFWNMPIIQDRDVKYPYKQYRYYLQAF